MARRQSASCNFCAMAQAMLLLLARPKMTALFCESLTNASAEKVIGSQSSVLSQAGKPRRVYQPWRTHRHSFAPLVARPLLQIRWKARSISFTEYLNTTGRPCGQLIGQSVLASAPSNHSILV